MQTAKKAKLVRADEISALGYSIPKSWKKAAGILKYKRNKTDPVKYQKVIRADWIKRFEKIMKLSQS